MFYAVILMMSPIILVGLAAFRLQMAPARLKLLLTFSAGYLFSLSIVHMLPEVFTDGGDSKAGVFVLIGFCLQLLIDTFSTGIEHGHVHLHSNTCRTHLPYGIIIGLMLHSFLEGLPVYDIRAHETDNVNFRLILGLAIHNLPITIAFVALLREHSRNMTASIGMLFVFAAMTPLGFFASNLLHTVGLQNYEFYSKAAYALVVGIFLHISTAILFEAGVDHKYNIRKTAVMVAGIIIAWLVS